MLDEIAKLFEVFKGDKMELCVHIAAYYGLCSSEYFGYVCRDNLGNLITPNFVTDHF